MSSSGWKDDCDADSSLLAYRSPRRIAYPITNLVAYILHPNEVEAVLESYAGSRVVYVCVHA
jgi:hypothetical protein